MAAVIPMAGWDTWLTVMERAGYQCECTTCPDHRRKGVGGRCRIAQTESSKLTAGPAQPGPDPARSLANAVTRAEDLKAWCGPCWRTAVSAARRAQRAADHVAQLDGDTDRLF